MDQNNAQNVNQAQAPNPNLVDHPHYQMVIAPTVARGNLVSRITGDTGRGGHLIFRTLDIGPFSAAKFGRRNWNPATGEIVPANGGNAAALANPDLGDFTSVFVVCRFRTRNWDNAKNLTILEVFAPDVPDDRYIPQPVAARAEMVRAAKEFFRDHEFQTWEEAYQAISLYTLPPTQNNQHRTVKNEAELMADGDIEYKVVMPQEIFDLINDQTGLLPENALAQINDPESWAWLIRVCGGKPTKQIEKMVREAFIEVIVAAAKTGICTVGFLTRLQNRLQRSTENTNLILTNERIKAVYEVIREFLSESSMYFYNQIVGQNIMPRFQPLLITLSMSKGHGLTGISIISRALQSYPTFNWQAIAMLIGEGEFRAAVRALQAVRWRPYAGYNSELMDAHGLKHYRRLVWVCSRVLQDIGGETTLSNYQGQPAGFPHAVLVDALITEFNERRSRAIQRRRAPDTVEDFIDWFKGINWSGIGVDRDVANPAAAAQDDDEDAPPEIPPEAFDGDSASSSSSSDDDDDDHPQGGQGAVGGGILQLGRNRARDSVRNKDRKSDRSRNKDRVDSNDKHRRREKRSRAGDQKEGPLKKQSQKKRQEVVMEKEMEDENSSITVRNKDIKKKDVFDLENGLNNLDIVDRSSSSKSGNWADAKEDVSEFDKTWLAGAQSPVNSRDYSSYGGIKRGPYDMKSMPGPSGNGNESEEEEDEHQKRQRVYAELREKVDGKSNPSGQ